MTPPWGKISVVKMDTFLSQRVSAPVGCDFPRKTRRFWAQSGLPAAGSRDPLIWQSFALACARHFKRFLGIGAVAGLTFA